MTLPRIGCPYCGFLVALDSDWCPRCESTLPTAVMRDAYEHFVHSPTESRPSPTT